MSVSMGEVRVAVKGYIAALNATGEDFEDDDNIVVDGIIESIQLLDLINFVADTYDIEITEAHVFDGRFASVDTIVQFVIADTAA